MAGVIARREGSSTEITLPEPAVRNHSLCLRHQCDSVHLFAPLRLQLILSLSRCVQLRAYKFTGRRAWVRPRVPNSVNMFELFNIYRHFTTQHCNRIIIVQISAEFQLTCTHVDASLCLSLEFRPIRR